MSGHAHILVVDDEPDIRLIVQEILEDEGYEVSVAEDAESARQARRARRPDLILLDIWMPDTDGVTLLREWSETNADASPVIMMSGHGTVETAVEATRLGAYDFIEKPLTTAKLLLAVDRALEAANLRRENVGLRQASDEASEPVGRSRTMQLLREQIQRIAQHDAPVLITGESGAGKELCARYMHASSARRHSPFIRLPVAALTPELLGSESTDDVRYGALERVSTGTLFLEEIAQTDPTVQARLLQVLEGGTFVRVDGQSEVGFNARIVAATSQDIETVLTEGTLREDLYYHLNVVPVNVPALRDHREDVPELLGYYLERLANKENLPFRRFTVGAQNRLRNHDWPGNIRELKNLVHRLLILGSGADIELEEIESALSGGLARRGNETFVPGELTLKEAREDFERRYLEYQIRRHEGSITKTADAAGVERTHLYRKLRALGIDPKTVAKGEDN